MERLVATTNRDAKPRIAVFSGPTATIQNTEPLVTSNKAREKYGLPPRNHTDGLPMRFDVLRPQRLAAPVTVYIEQFSAHPLERDFSELYAPPDGYIDAAGGFHKERTGPTDKPVYEVTLRPEDGLYPLPYMARQANGQAWEMDGSDKNVPSELCRVPFFPDGSGLFEEIDRLGVSDEGVGCLLTGKAEFDFYRALPSGGYPTGRRAACSEHGTPRIHACPRVGRSRPTSSRSTVVLPAPFGPRKPVTVPRPTARSRSSIPTVDP